MSNFRIFVEKKAKFSIEAKQLLADLQQNLHLNNLTSLRLINIYDIFAISPGQLEQVKYSVLAEPPVDNVYDYIDLDGRQWLAIEPLPGQYDQRSDSAQQAFHLLSITNPDLTITCGKLIVFNDVLTPNQLQKIKDYYINPLEYREKDLQQLCQEPLADTITPLIYYSGFLNYSDQQLAQFKTQHSLAMSLADLKCIQDYFNREARRDPSETEIKVLDTYWSDHCRHTTFETHLTNIEFAVDQYAPLFHQTFNDYLASRQYVYTNQLNTKPITLMDLATICVKQFKKAGALDDLELSEEINACSLVVDIEVDGKAQQWSLQFKNETHNHPTEIEPYGGAATCVGGAIRDPLSGRAYVYQAVRVSGAANPLEDVAATLPGKLPQKVITTKAAHGFSSYGNQIGLATTLVKEIYHPGYQAKRLEVGMVVAAAPYANICRAKPQAGDVIILVGGRTGRDGCGGATGSSKQHDSNSAISGAAEVQKGNPVIERHIQRLMRNSQLTRLIKKCNDFGAGGIAVAIGELAPGVKIYLDQVPTKYHGLSGTELAISESQERMAMVVAKSDAQQFIQLAISENLEATIVAEVTNQMRMQIYWRGTQLVDLARSFLNSNGAKTYASVKVEPLTSHSLLAAKLNPTTSLLSQIKELLSNLNICSQQGLSDRFDSTIGAATVLMPYGGKYQLTPAQVAVQKLPVVTGNSDAASLVSFGYDPYLSSSSTFHGGYYALVEAVAKVVAAGADYRKIRFSLQEYFAKVGDDPVKWSKPFMALLGAYKAQQQFGLAAIGGKDSMSGTFNQLEVPPTLIAFAVALTNANLIISPEFKNAHDYVYAFIPDYTLEEIIEVKQLTESYDLIQQLIAEAKLNAAYAIGQGGIMEALLKMSFGNKIGFELLASAPKLNLFNRYYGGLVIASPAPLEFKQFKLIATTTNTQSVNCYGEVVALNELIEVWQAKLAPIFPLTAAVADANFSAEINSRLTVTQAQLTAAVKIAKPRVLIPVFPGSNCEYDSLRAFTQAGARAETVVFNNLTTALLHQSITKLTKLINNTQILMLPGGFSAGDEPDGSAKFITAVLRNQQIQDAIHALLARDGLILGICNGFQALIKSGLLPASQISHLNAASPTLTYNVIGRHISRISSIKIVNNYSPWLSSFSLGAIKQVPMSHGEGRLIISPELAKTLAATGQIACQYVDEHGDPTLDSRFNPNGSDYAIEAITSLDGRILGKMGHCERKGTNLYKNISGDTTQDIFINGVNYYN